MNNYIIMGRSVALQKMYDIIVSDRPSIWYEEIIKGKKSAEEGLVIHHEKYVSGSSFSQQYEEKKKWYNKMFNRKGKY